MATVKLSARARTATGKQGAKHTRDQGQVPAVLYGEKGQNVPLSVDARELRTALATQAGRNVIVQIGLDGGETSRAVIRELTRDPITREILHVDFQRISENKPIHIRVPVILMGVSPAVKEARGILDHTMRDVEIRCLPKDIPMSIDVDISMLDVGHAIHVRDLKQDGIEFLDIPERPVVDILQPTIYKIAEEGEEGEEGGEGAKADSEETAEES
jgi:large subunit ribosomal protein L25